MQSTNKNTEIYIHILKIFYHSWSDLHFVQLTEKYKDLEKTYKSVTLISGKHWITFGRKDFGKQWGSTEKNISILENASVKLCEEITHQF